jgi:hypothetical protein
MDPLSLLRKGNGGETERIHGVVRLERPWFTVSSVGGRKRDEGFGKRWQSGLSRFQPLRLNAAAGC